MINSLLLCIGCNSKYKLLSSIVRIAILVNLIYVQYSLVNNIFFVLNVLLLFAIPQIISKIKNKYINITMSIISILIWSIFVDIISYYLFSLFTSSCSVFIYILNGIIFNFKFVIFNSILLTIIYLINSLISKNKIFSKKSYVVYKTKII